jgi:hypothetical protein
VLLGNTIRRSVGFHLQGYYLLWPDFPDRSINRRFCNSSTAPVRGQMGPTTPLWQRHRALTPQGFGLIPFRSPLLRDSFLLSLPRGNEMFQFPRFPPQLLCVQSWVPAHDRWWVSPFGHPRINGCLAPSRGLSQPATSFVGSWRLGIHRTLLLAWYRCSRSLWSFQGSERASGSRVSRLPGKENRRPVLLPAERASLRSRTDR